MILLGLTGGVGMGKSTAASHLEQLGVPSLDTDAIAREVVEPGQPALDEIRASFGEAVVHPEGRLNRSELARIVFGDPAGRKQLEAILHPRIREVWLARVQIWREENRSSGVVIIPLLFETEAAGHFDATVCVACSVATQRSRLLTRGWSDQQIRQRIESQWPMEAKIDRSTFVIWSEGELAVLIDQLKAVLRNLGLR